ncbi:MAG: hypothetical protein AB1757_25445 [Acidobacteriota bacterium]
MKRVNVVLICCALILSSAQGFAVSPSVKKKIQKRAGVAPSNQPVTVTLVRWPYT